MFQPTPSGGWTVQYSQISRLAIFTKLRKCMRNSARYYVEITINANCFSQACMAIEHALKIAYLSSNILNIRSIAKLMKE